MTIDPIWEKIHSTQDWGQYPSEDVIRFMAKYFYSAPDRSKVRVLDLGCGGGAHAWYLVREGFEVYALDGSWSSYRKTVNRLRSVREDNWFVGKFDFSEPFPSYLEDFDAIIDAASITHNDWDASRKIYRECHRVLKPGGKMLTRMFAPFSMLEGRGFVRCTAFADIAELIYPFKILNTDWLTRLSDFSGSQIHISEWSVIAEKAAE